MLISRQGSEEGTQAVINVNIKYVCSKRTHPQHKNNSEVIETLASKSDKFKAWKNHKESVIDLSNNFQDTY